MFHGIEVHLMADIEKYKQGMEAAKKIGTESMGFISSTFDAIKRLGSGMWDSLKSAFSGIGSASKGSFDSISTSATGAFQKIGAMLPSFNAGLDKTKQKMGETEEKSDGLATKIGVGLVVAITAAIVAITALVKKGLEADAAMASVSVSSNLAASQISRFEATAARSNVSATEFAGSMVKLREEMKKAAAGSGGDVFEKMGVTIVDANNALLKTDEVTIEVAKKIAAMSTEAEKYAAASKIGFEGKVQVLEDIARASDLSASTTDEQAAAVVRLGKIWHDILPGGKSMWAEISSFLTTSLTPAMTDASVSILAAKNKITAAFKDIFGAGSMFPALSEKIKDWGLQASQWFGGVADSASSATVKIMQFIAAKTGLGNANAPLTTAPGAIPGSMPLAKDSGKPIVKEEDRKQLEEYRALSKAIEEKTEAQRMEFQTGMALTEGQRMAIKMAVDLRDGTVKMTDAQKIERTEMLSTLIAQEKANAAAADARKNSASAADKEAKAYESLIAAIVTQTNANKVAVAAGEDATQSQKNQIKLEQELAAGKITTASASYAVVRAKLLEQATSEDALKQQTAEKEVTKFIVAGTLARDDATRALDAEYAMYGKSNDAREIAMVAVKSETEMQKQLDALREKKLPINDKIIAQLSAERDARTLVGEATLGQSKALSYANQLADENHRFAAESLFDEKARAAALLKIDAAMWQERIALAGAGTDAQKRLQEEYSIWYSNQLSKPEIEANRKMWESIDTTAHDTFVSIFDSGKSAFDRLRDTLKNGLLDLLYQMTIKKWILNIGASVSGAGATSLAMAGDLSAASGAVGGGLGGVANLAQSAKTAYTIATQGFSGVAAGIGGSIATLGNLFGSSAVSAFGTGMSLTAAQASTAAAAYGSAGMAGTGSALTAGAAAGPLVAAAAGIAAGVLGGRAISGQYGSNSTVNAGTGIGAVAGAFMGGPIGAAIGGALGGVIGGLANRAFGMGDKKYGETGITGTLSGSGFTGEEYAKWTQKGGWFRSDKKDTDRKAVDGTTSNAFVETYAAIRNVSATLANTLGVDTSGLATRAQALNINLTGLTTEADRLGAVTKFFEGVGNAIALELVPSLGQFKVGNEELSTTLQRVAGDYAGVDAALQLIGRTSQDAFGAVGVATIGARENLIKLAGSLDSLSSGTSFFAENFLTEAEQMAPVLSIVADTLGKLGMAGSTTMEDYKKKVLGLNLASAADQELYIKLLALAPAFKAASDYSNQLAAATGNYAAVVKTASEIASERMDLQKQLNELTKSETELLAIQRSSIAAVNRALFDQVQAAKAVVSAKDALGKAYDREAAAATTALDKSKSWVTTLNSLNASLALGAQSTLTPEQKYAEARAQFEKTLAAANAGDTTAQSGLSAAEQAFLTASQVVNASDARYAADYARVLAANDEALKWASAQVDVQQASLDALKAQVSGLITINDSVLTVAQAIANLQAAMGTATGLGVQFDGSHAGGLANVPFDGYAAELHRGEVVVDAPAAAAMRRYFGGAPSQGGGNTDALVAEIKRLNEKVDKLNADSNRNAGATIQATVESNDKAAKTVVAGVDKSAKASAWAKQVEYSQ